MLLKLHMQLKCFRCGIGASVRCFATGRAMIIFRGWGILQDLDFAGEQQAKVPSALSSGIRFSNDWYAFQPWNLNARCHIWSILLLFWHWSYYLLLRQQYKARPITVTEATHWLVLMDMKTSRTIPFEGKRYAIILMSLKSMTMMRKEARAPI